MASRSHDPYRWLEDGDADETAAWTEAQNARTEAVLSGLPGRDELHRHLSELFAAGTSGAPSLRGDRLFSLERWGDHEQAVLVVRAGRGRAPAPSSTPTR